MAVMGQSFYRPGEEFAFDFAALHHKNGIKKQQQEKQINPNCICIQTPFKTADTYIHSIANGHCVIIHPTTQCIHRLSTLIYTHNCSAGACCSRIGVSASLTAGPHRDTKKHLHSQTRALLHYRQLWRCHGMQTSHRKGSCTSQ